LVHHVVHNTFCCLIHNRPIHDRELNHYA
jgi:hypothetical protein